jgi:hypothetical protein
MNRRITKILLWTGLITLALVGAGIALWVRTFHHYLPQELVKDVQAGLAARHMPEPTARVEAFLEARYGALTNPTNRQQAFLDFFNVDHIRGLNFIVDHSPASQKQANTQAMAHWIANYRNSMSVEERTALQACLNSEMGRAMLRQATAQFQSQDVYYRGAQQTVVKELMTTLADLRKP